MMSLRWWSPFNVVFRILVLCVVISGSRRTHAAKMESRTPRDEIDGWRPIVGKHQHPFPLDEITHYRNPASKRADPVKAEKEEPTTMAKKSSSPPKPLFVIPNIGMHIVPLPSAHRPHKFNHLLKIHQPQTLLAGKPVRPKPIRHQVPAYSTRDEVFLPAPASNIGPYTFYSASPSVLKPPHNPIRSTTHSHIDFANHFPIANTDDELYQIVREPVHQYVIPHHAKAPLINDVHYTFQNPDDYHRQVPPMPYKFESTKLDAGVKTKKEKPLMKVHPYLISTPHPPGVPGQNKVDVQITKEKLKVFHNVIPPNFSPLEEYDFRQLKVTPPTPPRLPVTYEVTEGKWSPEAPLFQYHFPNPIVIPIGPKKRLPYLSPGVITEESKPFLPTPVKPDSIPPTLPTQGEIATIYNQVKAQRLRTPNPITPNSFDVKEVSTHYPIIGTPEVQTLRYQSHRDEENEITTKSTTEAAIEMTTLPFIPMTRKPSRQRRPQRRRRPSSTSTTEVEEIMEVDGPTEAYEVQKIEITTEPLITTSRPSRVRPTRLRSTIPITTKEYHVEEVTIPARLRHRRPRPTTTEEPKIQQSEHSGIVHESLEDKIARLTTTTDQEFPANFESHFTTPFKSEQSTEEVFIIKKEYSNPPNRGGERVKTRVEEVEGGEVVQEPTTTGGEDVNTEEEERITNEDLRGQFYNEKNIKEEIVQTPENELDYSTMTTGRPETSTEVSTTTTTPYTIIIAQAEPTARTMKEPSTTLRSITEIPKRMRGRPNKYDSSSRPRFSVKDYRQRITASTPVTTTSAAGFSDATLGRTQSEVMRLRFPNRSRRPITMSSTTTTSTITPNVDEEMTERSRFQPHHPRHTSSDGATEKFKFHTVNTRIRPFGRYKATTDTPSTTMKVSIKPNLFANFRRPTPISLRTRILSRQRNSTTIRPEVTTLPDGGTIDDEQLNNDSEQTETVETTIPYSIDQIAAVDFDAKKVDVEGAPSGTVKRDEESSKSDDLVQSQIVSALTSSLQNDYNTPGLFKNVQPNSRKVPSYFTLATDDPILPIEAFFPKLKV